MEAIWAETFMTKGARLQLTRRETHILSAQPPRAIFRRPPEASNRKCSRARARQILSGMTLLSQKLIRPERQLFFRLILEVAIIMNRETEWRLMRAVMFI